MGSGCDRCGGVRPATTPEEAAAVAHWCRVTAAEVEGRLAGLRDHLSGLEPGGLGMSPTRLEAVLAGYDIYVRMLVGALTDTAAALADAAGPSGAAPPRTFVLTGTAAGVLAELTTLRRALEPIADRPAGSGGRIAPEVEWNIAVDGLFGPTGVLGVIARASGEAWPHECVAVPPPAAGVDGTGAGPV
jgi:hypothetical protein